MRSLPNGQRRDDCRSLTKLAILGASGHGTVIADAALRAGWADVAFFDDAWPSVTVCEQWPVLGRTEDLIRERSGFDGVVVAIGQNAVRLAKVRELDGVDLLVTDYHLRDGETGIQVIAAVRQAIRTPLGAVLITGDTSTAIKELPVDPNLRVASKPIRAEELLGLIRVLLGSG